MLKNEFPIEKVTISTCKLQMKHKEKQAQKKKPNRSSFNFRFHKVNTKDLLFKDLKTSFPLFLFPIAFAILNYSHSLTM